MRLIQNPQILLCLAFLAMLMAASPSLAQTATSATPPNPIVTMKRSFHDGPFGQVHVRIAQPHKNTQKPPLVLFHPTPYSSDYFQKFMRLMARDRTVIAIDTPGYGDSDRPKTLQSINGYAASAAAVLRALGYDENSNSQVDLLGYHTGCLIAVELAVQHPKLVRRLVLPGLPFFSGEERGKAYEANAKPDQILEDGSHLTKKWEFASAATTVNLPLERVQEHFNDLMQCHPHCWEAYHGVFTYPAENRFQQIEQPVLLITNDGSLKQETEAALPLFPNAEIHHIDGITLGGFDLAPEKYKAVILPFLGEDPVG